MAKIEIDIELLMRLAEIAASALNNTVSHEAVKEETKASDNDIQAAAYMFQRLSEGSNAGLPESITEFNEFSTALKNSDFDNRFFV